MNRYANLVIPMRDGVRLSATIYMPISGPDSQDAWPVVFVSNPYANDVFFGPRNRSYYEDFVAAGYCVAVVDFRGTGASEGVKDDAFQSIEQDDVYDCIEHIAKQEWSNGDVVAWGLSYSGVTALRAATCGAPSLRAVVAIEGSTDPYHYEVAREGVVGLAMIIAEWSTFMVALASIPPSSATWLSDQAMLGRLEAMRPWHNAWLHHPHRDDYWSGREVDVSSICVPALFITGWRDTNVRGAWNDFHSARGPRRIICGPWVHGMPEESPDSPMNSVGEAIAWFDQHLKRERSGEDHEEVSVASYAMGGKMWREWPQFPPSGTSMVKFYMDARRLSQSPLEFNTTIFVPFDATTGVTGGLGMTAPPSDQTRDADLSVVCASNPVLSTTEIAGSAVVTIYLEALRHSVDVVVKLLDVSPQGHKKLITKAFRRLDLNRESKSHRLVAEGYASRLDIELPPTHYQLAPGHSVALAFCAADFPEYWPNVSGRGYTILSGPEFHSLLQLPIIKLSCLQQRDLPGENDTTLDPEGLADAGVQVKLDSSTGKASVSGVNCHEFDNDAGELVKIRHQYSVSTYANRPRDTLLITHTEISVAEGDSDERWAESHCTVTPHSSFASLRVKSARIDREFEWLVSDGRGTWFECRL